MDVITKDKVNAWRLVWLGALLSALLCFPSIYEGLKKDDIYHRSLLTGEPFFSGDVKKDGLPLLEATNDFFVFFGSKNPHNLERAVETGAAPWWVDSRLEIAFWRPLAALTHWLDYQLWPDSPRLMHLHSVIWYFLLIATWGACLLEIIGLRKWTLGVCVLLFGLDASHADAVGWIANRNILIAACFGFLSLLFYHRNAQRPNYRVYLLSVLCFVSALLSAEGGLAITAYLAAYAFILDKNPIKKRILTFIPFPILVVIWRAIYSYLGYGAGYSGGYLDPVAQKAEFIANMMVQIPTLIMDQLTAFESLPQALSPSTLQEQAIIATLVVGVLFLIWTPYFRNQRTFAFLVLSAIAATVPAGSTIFTGGRLMFVAGAGLSAAVGVFVMHVFLQVTWLPKNRLYKYMARVVASVLILAQVIANSYVWYAKINSQISNDELPDISNYADVISTYNSKADVAIVVNPPAVFDFLFAQPAAAYSNRPYPSKLRPLVPGGGSFVLKRTALDTIEVEARDNAFYISSNAKLDVGGAKMSHWYAKHRLDTFFAGSSYQVTKAVGINNEMLATVLEENDEGLPNRIRFKFNEALESSKYQWFCWESEKELLSSCKPPEIGQAIDFDGAFK